MTSKWWATFGLLGAIWAAPTAHAQEIAPCPEEVPPAADEVEEALRQLLRADMDQAFSALTRAEESFQCGEVADPEVLARFWLVEGATLNQNGEEVAAAESFAAAARVAPDVWIAALGTGLREQYKASILSDPGMGTVTMEPLPESPETVYIDGVEATLPATIEEGVHLVQVTKKANKAVRFGKVLGVIADASQVVEYEPRPDPAPTTTAGTGRFGSGPIKVHLGLGTSVGFGEALSDPTGGDFTDYQEPAVKVSIPIEVGFSAHYRAAFFRLAALGAPLANGRYLFQPRDNSDLSIGNSPIGLGGHLTVGGTIRNGHIGASGGLRWPRRATTRVVGGYGFGDTGVRFELRAGVDLATGETQGSIVPEGAGEILFVYAPGFANL